MTDGSALVAFVAGFALGQITATALAVLFVWLGTPKDASND